MFPVPRALLLSSVFCLQDCSVFHAEHIKRTPELPFPFSSTFYNHILNLQCCYCRTHGIHPRTYFHLLSLSFILKSVVVVRFTMECSERRTQNTLQYLYIFLFFPHPYLHITLTLFPFTPPSLSLFSHDCTVSAVFTLRCS